MQAQHKYTVAYNLHTFVNSINSTWQTSHFCTYHSDTLCLHVSLFVLKLLHVNDFKT